MSGIIQLHTQSLESKVSERTCELEQRILEIEGLQDALRHQALRDSLTGLYNRRYFDEALAKATAHALRKGEKFSLVLVDIDHFKRINDSYGHHAGDEALRIIAKLLENNSRAEDIVCRWGGEEFIILMPGADVESTLGRAESWRAAIENTPIQINENCLQSTISIGIAGFPDDADSPETLLMSADKALYRAKSSGRNKVVVFMSEITSVRLKPE